MSLKKLLGQIDQMSLESGAHPTIPGIMAPEVAADYLAEQAELAEVEADLDETLEKAEEVLDGEVLLESAIAELEEGGEDGSEPLSMESMYTLRGRVLEVTGQDIFANKPMSLEGAQEMSLEGVKEILAAVKSAGGKVAGALGEQINWYMTKFFDGMGKAKKWLSAIDSKLGSAKGDPKGPIAVSKLFGRYLANDAGSIAPADVVKHLNEVTKEMNGFESNFEKAKKEVESKYKKRLEEIIEKASTDGSKKMVAAEVQTILNEILESAKSKKSRKDGQTVEAVTVTAKEAKNVSKALAATISSFEGWKNSYDKVTGKMSAEEMSTEGKVSRTVVNVYARAVRFIAMFVMICSLVLMFFNPLFIMTAISAMITAIIFSVVVSATSTESASVTVDSQLDYIKEKTNGIFGEILVRMAKYQNSVIKAGLVYLDNATKQLDIEVPAAPVTETPGGDAA